MNSKALLYVNSTNACNIINRKLIYLMHTDQLELCGLRISPAININIECGKLIYLPSPLQHNPPPKITKNLHTKFRQILRILSARDPY